MDWKKNTNFNGIVGLKNGKEIFTYSVIDSGNQKLILNA